MIKHRIALIEGGTYFHYFSFQDPQVRHLITKTVYLRDLRAQDLQDVDTVVLMSRLNPQLLQQKKDIILDFHASGKKLVILAANNPQNWFPQVTFTDSDTNFWWWLEKNPDSGLTICDRTHEMFNFLDDRALIWHYHGMFTPPSDALNIVTCREGGSILYQQKDGTILTTLDPDYHHGSFFMPGATLFWHGLINYLAYRNA